MLKRWREVMFGLGIVMLCMGITLTIVYDANYFELAGYFLNITAGFFMTPFVSHWWGRKK